MSINLDQNSIYYFKVNQQQENSRIDKFLTEQLNMPHLNHENINNLRIYSRSAVSKLIKSGFVSVNKNVITDCDYKLNTQHIVLVDLKAIYNIATESKITPKNIEFDIIYEDDYLLVINKPAGLTVHPGKGTEDTLINALLAKYNEVFSKFPDQIRPGIVHRLDKNTSGIMIVAKDEKTRLLLSKQLSERQISRVYLALVYGRISPIIGTIEANIARDRNDHTKMTVSNNDRGKKAVTHYKMLKAFGNNDGKNAISLLECKLETGRTHQIRAHFSFKRHPLIGDLKYMNSYNFNLLWLEHKAREVVKNFPRQALHALKLSFTHPIYGVEQSFACEIPEDIKSLISMLENNQQMQS